MNAAELTIDRLFAAPALAGRRSSAFTPTADHSRIYYLRGRIDDDQRLDLWEFDVATRRSRLAVDADLLCAADTAPSPEEQARRERQRTAALSGILDFSLVGPGDSIIVPVDGRIFLVGARPGEAPSIERLASAGTGCTDVRVSPRGRFVSYVRDRNLHVLDLGTRTARALTSDGNALVGNGMAEFVAQEEMDRHTGYWWSPDERLLAFARIDESAVRARQRFEIGADDVFAFEQRYPAAGEPNAVVTLGIVDIATAATTWIDPGTDPDVYVARVQWLPDGRTLAIQRQDRDQRRLDLLFVDAATGRTRPVLTETSDSWIDLNDELTFLRSGEFLWASARDGYTHLYLHSADGTPVRQLTRGPWNVVDFRGRAIRLVDEQRRLVYFLATERSPRCRDLYAAPLDSDAPQGMRRITVEAGLHAVTMTTDAPWYVDRHTSAGQPPRVSLRNLDGSLHAWIDENAVDAAHPAGPYLAGNSMPEFGTLPADDGQALHYQLFRPADFDAGRRHPAVVMVYGGPAHQEVLDQWRGDSFAQVLTRAGFVVFQLDNRGSAFRGTAFQAPLSGRLGGVEVEDQVRGARWLASLPFVDAGRIGVMGWSYGGYLTLMLMFRAPDVFRAGVAGAPVTDWTLYDTHYTERFLGRPQDHPGAYAHSAVLPYAPGLAGSLLLVHGMADDNVLFTHSTRLMRRLQELGKPFELMVYPGEKHGMLRGGAGRHAYATMLGFFARNLG